MIVRDTTGWPIGVIESNKFGYYEVTYFGEDEPEDVGMFLSAKTATLALKLREQLWRLGQREFSHVLLVQLELAAEIESELQEKEAHHA